MIRPEKVCTRQGKKHSREPMAKKRDMLKLDDAPLQPRWCRISTPKIDHPAIVTNPYLPPTTLSMGGDYFSGYKSELQ